jgi:hypothetical protein
MTLRQLTLFYQKGSGYQRLFAIAYRLSLANSESSLKAKQWKLLFAVWFLIA